MLCGAGVSVDDDSPVRYVISDAATMVAAFVAGGLELSGDDRFRAAARLLTPPAASRSSCRAAHTSCTDIFRFEGRLPRGRRRSGGDDVGTPSAECCVSRVFSPQG
jgi:hypothetical protein